MITRRIFQAGAGAALAGLAVSGRAAASIDLHTSESSFKGAQLRLAAKLLTAQAGGKAGRGAALSSGDLLIVSPMSALLSLSVVALLADHAMRQSLARALQFGTAAADPFEVAIKLGRTPGAEGGQAPPLTTADLLLLDRGVEPNPYVLAGLKQGGVEVQVDDLRGAEAVRSANDWVKAQTNGLIPTILDGPPGQGGLVALNALHFKDQWKTPFDPAMTANAPFYGAGGRTTTVPMMRAQGERLFRQEKGLGAVDLPFGTLRFSLVLVTRTDDKPATAADLVRDAGNWLFGDGFSPRPGEVALPRLDIAATTDILATLTAAGLQNRPLASLGANAPVLRAVTQRALFRMDEAGAEAAAATAALATRGMDNDFIKLVFDRPFLFALRDTTTDLLVLAGYVGQVPGATRT